MKLTTLEQSLLNAIANSEYQSNVGEGIINYPVWSGVDFFSIPGLSTRKSFNGVMASLSKKGLVKCSNYSPTEPTVALTAEGFKLLS